MVVAGPGTGKTQLLSMRVASILRRTDALPGNILCLTFTESAANAMRERLVSIIGTEGYNVAIHTFHSFGTEVINHYPEYFYQGAHFRPSDELTSFEVLEEIFVKLPASNPLASTMNGEFTALGDVQRTIGLLKKAGLTPDELLQVLDHNDQFINFAEPLLAKIFDVPRLGKKEIASAGALVEQLAAFQDSPPPIALMKPLSELCVHELQIAVEEAQTQNSTKPLTAWRNRWLERNHQREYILKDRTRAKKLRAVSDIYYKYLLSMQTHELFDFDDMILRVLHALEYSTELRFNLQEQYQYVLVDEFQDTNGAQLRLLQSLLNSEVNNGRPNIMVVGDDDQAIYAFQGAEISNILDFNKLYREPTIIALTDNYRSTDTILRSAREVITQGEYRLETSLQISKELSAHNKHLPTVSALQQFANPTHQYTWIADEITTLIKQGVPPSEITVIARNHRQLLELLPFLRQARLNINYERRNNVLEAEHITALLLLARTIVALAEQQFDVADSLLPQLLSCEFWTLKTTDVWKLSLAAYKERRFWLELMLERDDKLRAIAEFLIIASHEALHQPLEYMLDVLIGTHENQAPGDEADEAGAGHHDGPAEEFVSPFRAYYFTAERLQERPAEYLAMLSNLAVIRRKLRDYRPGQTLLLSDFVAFADLHAKTHLAIVDTAEHQDAGQSINVMTAHKAKGLEFNVVFVLSCQENIWGATARSRSSSIALPHNLPLEPAGQTADDCLRLFFVAMTRARHVLHLCMYQTDDAGKESLVASFLSEIASAATPHQLSMTTEQLATLLEPDWRQRQLTAMTTVTMADLLKPRLAAYQLSVTHLNNFIDVVGGGPQAFLLQNLLRFPQAMTRSAAFGSAIHTVLQRAHVHLSVTGERRPSEDILHDFELQLQASRLSEQDMTYLIEKGSGVLETFLAQRHSTFHPDQKVEYGLRDIALGPARLTGTIDLLDINKDDHTIAVTDYKTGKAPANWQGATDFEKIKLHKYRQQLMFYKLLVEHSRDFGGTFTVKQATLEFVEPDGAQQVRHLSMTFDAEELERFTRLIQAIWQHIMELRLPDTSVYPPTYKGMLAFEQDLLDGTQ